MSFSNICTYRPQTIRLRSLDICQINRRYIGKFEQISESILLKENIVMIKLIILLCMTINAIPAFTPDRSLTIYYQLMLIFGQKNDILKYS